MKKINKINGELNEEKKEKEESLLFKWHILAGKITKRRKKKMKKNCKYGRSESDIMLNTFQWKKKISFYILYIEFLLYSFHSFIDFKFLFYSRFFFSLHFIRCLWVLARLFSDCNFPPNYLDLCIREMDKKREIYKKKNQRVAFAYVVNIFHNFLLLFFFSSSSFFIIRLCVCVCVYAVLV